MHISLEWRDFHLFENLLSILLKYIYPAKHSGWLNLPKSTLIHFGTLTLSRRSYCNSSGREVNIRRIFVKV